jgi:hypothetical protein
MSAQFNVVGPLTANYQAYMQDLARMNAAAGGLTVTAPQAVSGGSFIVEKTDASANAVTVVGSPGVLFSGVASLTLTAQYEMVEFISLPSGNFNVVSLNTSSPSYAGAVTAGSLITDSLVTKAAGITVAANAGAVPVTNTVSNFTNSSAAAMTVTLAVTGAVDGQLSIVRVYDFSAAAETITWVNTENGGATAPTTSNGSTTLPKTVWFQFNAQTTKWRCILSA